ncbi:MAG: glycosyltransferase, partial [Flavisolibacter sp.]
KRYRLYESEIYSFGGSNKTGLSAYIMRRNVRKELKKIHATHKLIGILSFWYGECAVIGKKFAEAYRIPHYCWVLGQDARKMNVFPARLKPEAKELIALSDFVQEEFYRNHSIKPEHVIPPGIELLNNHKERDIDILAVGSLIPLKQYEIFIDLVAELHKSFPLIKAVIVGQGPERKHLEEHIDVKKMKGIIQIKGLLTYPETLEMMQRSKILVHPSSYEGFSGVCMEALAAGMNVVSFCKPMKTDFPQWHIVEDKKSMKEKLIELLKNENTSYKCIQLFKMEDSVREMMKLFESLPAGRQVQS